ncbi:MAG: DUF58 domain-containing protein [Chitinispirillia bacterium]|nr:DUF58 domain-containing protein [Chitinispirillia bacterium]MCL2242401.1 DUF58 domain-containing protein [Chitinispirillia bacterium]
MNSFSVLNPEHMAPVRNLTLRAKMIVEGTIAGLHKSPFHGFSSEFLEYRPYLAGEPARKIDWRKYAKSDKSVVRLYEDETNLAAHILLDKSASMGFGSGIGGMTKFDYARTLAASFAWILVRQKDAVGLAAFDEEMRWYMPPKSTNLQLKNIISYLESSTAENQTRCGDVINSAAAMVKKRGLCIVISDFFDDPESVAMGLRHLRFKRQDILALAVADPMELDFGGKTDFRFKDLETGRELTIDSQTASDYFNRGFTGHHAALSAICRELKIDFEVVTTAEPFHKSLLAVIEKRRRLY